MQEDLISTIPDFKLYKDNAISTATFLGGPLVAGYLIAENFKALKQFEKAKTAWLIAIVGTIIIFGGIFLIPGAEKLPSYIIPVIYTSITRYLVKRYQQPEIDEHIKNGGQTYTIWRGVLIGLAGLIIMLAIVFLVIYFTGYGM